MLMDWLLPRAGMMLAFLLLSGVMWTAYQGYDLHAANGEAKALAEEIADQIAMVANAAPEYSRHGFARKVQVPGAIHGVPYELIIDASRFQVRIELLGGYDGRAVGVAFLPASAIYDGDRRVLNLEGFEVADSEGMTGRVVVGKAAGLWVERIGGEDKLRIVVLGADGDGVP